MPTWSDPFRGPLGGLQTGQLVGARRWGWDDIAALIFIVLS
jgi:hypothetical protein